MTRLNRPGGDSFWLHDQTKDGLHVKVLAAAPEYVPYRNVYTNNDQTKYSQQMRRNKTGATPATGEQKAKAQEPEKKPAGDPDKASAGTGDAAKQEAKEQKPAAEPEPAEIQVTGRTVIDLDFYIDRAKRSGYMPVDGKFYDEDNAVWCQKMKLTPVQLKMNPHDAAATLPQFIEFTVVAVSEGTLRGSVKSHERTGWKTEGPQQYDKARGVYLQKMKKQPQER